MTSKFSKQRLVKLAEEIQPTPCGDLKKLDNEWSQKITRFEVPVM